MLAGGNIFMKKGNQDTEVPSQARNSNSRTNNKRRKPETYFLQFLSFFVQLCSEWTFKVTADGLVEPWLQKVGLCNEEMFKDTAEGKEKGEAAASRSSL